MLLKACSMHTKQNGEGRNVVTHQFSLPKTSLEKAVIEKFLQFQDSIPCQIRAKRGCATHPRIIAERVRRIRINERLRKLHELVPNMDKQTHNSLGNRVDGHVYAKKRWCVNLYGSGHQTTSVFPRTGFISVKGHK